MGRETAAGSGEREVPAGPALRDAGRALDGRASPRGRLNLTYLSRCSVVPTKGWLTREACALWYGRVYVWLGTLYAARASVVPLKVNDLPAGMVVR